jgi:IPT/TIG domain
MHRQLFLLSSILLTAPYITDVSPTIGSTVGAVLYITGTSFGTDPSAVIVEVDGLDCQIESVTDTEIIVVTPELYGGVDLPVNVTVNYQSSSNSGTYSCSPPYIDLIEGDFTTAGGQVMMYLVLFNINL